MFICENVFPFSFIGEIASFYQAKIFFCLNILDFKFMINLKLIKIGMP